MSRTYRNKPYSWYDRDPLIHTHCREEEVVWEDAVRVVLVYDWCIYSYRNRYYHVQYDPKSETGKKRIAEARRDKVIRFKEPGPSWFRNMYEERPLRRQSKRELQRYMLDEEYEPIIDAKQRKKIYWT